jgi:TonB family protein
MKSLSTGQQPLRRFEIALAASLAINAAAWLLISRAVQYKVAAPPIPLEFERVIIDKKGRTVPQIVKPLPPPKPKPKPPEPKPLAKPVEQPKPASKPPETAHNRILTAPKPKGLPKPTDFDVQKGGRAKPGVPTETQGPGNSDHNPQPAPPPIVTAPAPPTPTPQPRPVEPKPAPPQPKPAPLAPEPAPPPKPKGETKDAVATHQVNVEIPEDLKSQSFKSFVRVRVTIVADGSFTVFLRSSSGNPRVDKLVVDALNQWKWEPALKDGEPVDSVQAFRFNFNIQ